MDYLILLIGLPKLTYVTSNVLVHISIFLIFCNIFSGILKIQVSKSIKLPNLFFPKSLYET